MSIYKVKVAGCYLSRLFEKGMVFNNLVRDGLPVNAKLVSVKYNKKENFLNLEFEKYDTSNFIIEQDIVFKRKQ